jgi:glycosyltransferase involved in cell wall biosynthesis
MPLISVLLPVFNSEKYVRAAVESLCTQTFRDFEVIAVNDGSTDSSGEVLRLCAKADQRIRVYEHRPNRGYVHALNFALTVAQGKYLARQDADDISHPDRFQRQVGFLEANPKVGVVGSAIGVFGDNRPNVHIARYPLTNSELQACALHGGCFAHPAVMMRSSVLKSADGYRAGFQPAEDYDLWLRLAEVTEFANLPDALVNYRQHPGQVSVRHARQQMLATLAARRCAELRRAGQADPGIGLALVTEDFLRDLGFRDQEIEGAVAAWLIDQARKTSDVALYSLCDDLLRQAEATIVSLSLARDLQFTLRWTRARRLVLAKQFLAGALAFLKAGALHPCSTAAILSSRRFRKLSPREASA